MNKPPQCEICSTQKRQASNGVIITGKNGFKTFHLTCNIHTDLMKGYSFRYGSTFEVVPIENILRLRADRKEVKK